MPSLRIRIDGFLQDDNGATAIEYGLIAGMIALSLIVAMTAFGNSLSGLFNYVRDEATTAMDNAG
jgi:pilus assembly protein Flp/PilA